MATENLSRIAADFETQLSGAIPVGATSFTLQSIADIDGNDLSDGIYCFTLDRDNTSAKEYLIGQLTAATKTVSSISSISRQGVATANAQRAHRIGANVIISDHSILAAISRIFTGQGTINPASPLAYTTAPTLSSANELATKGYVDSVVTGGTVNSDRIILGAQIAGETVAAGNIVYFKSADQRWWLADADLTATFSGLQIGVAQGSGTAGNAISGGVLIYGKADNFSGLTAGSKYYLSNTAGGVSTSAGTNSVELGFAQDADTIYFNPNTKPLQDWQLAGIVPVGSVISYISATPPSGWLNCDGAAVSRTTYANLFAVISTTFGAGDGSTTFNVPDLKDRMILGYAASAPTKVFTFASRSSNTITATGMSNAALNEIQTGQAVVYVSSGSVITGLTSTSTYYIIRVAYNQFQLASSVGNANAGVAISLSSDGTGTQTFTATYTARPLAEQGGEETHALTDAEMPSHVHPGDGGRSFMMSTGGGSGGGSSSNQSAANTGSQGGDAIHNNLSLYTVLNFIIKT